MKGFFQGLLTIDLHFFTDHFRLNFFFQCRKGRHGKTNKQETNYKDCKQKFDNFFIH